MRLPSLAGLLACLLAPVQAYAAEAPRTIIVMDGSGSMWGQIDGRTKLEIARETVAGVLGSLPADREVGLLAYGHRTKGQCDDIELLVSPAPGTAPQILTAVNTMKFLGKTPLSQAVRQAAEALRFTEDAATVVLVTDGLETCNADPCALGAELEAAGLDFTAHVIGFGLSAREGTQISCLARNTGGRYFDAGNADGLADALRQTVATAAAPPPKAPPAVAPEPLPEATLEAPAELPAAKSAPIGWKGPAAELDTIEIGRADDGERWTYAYVADGNPVTLLMPPEPGPYELRYRFRDQTVIARRPITITEVQATLTAPDKALAGSEVSIAWAGPDADYDNIQITPAGSDSYLSYAYVRDNNPATLIMPDEPGQYELHYKLADREVIATRPIEVLPADAVLPDAVLPKTPVPAPTEAAPVEVTLSAETGTLELSIQWSAVPVPGQGLPAEAWALQEGSTAPVTETFLPGEYDVRGDAGDTVFAGRIRVTPEGPNRFVIPVSDALSPAGEDRAAAPDASRRACAGPEACRIDDASGLSFTLPAGWSADEPFLYETAGGARAAFPSATFTGKGGQPILQLNPIRWVESNGPCTDSPAGPLCIVGAADAASLAGLATILPSLAYTPAGKGAP